MKMDGDSASKSAPATATETASPSASCSTKNAASKSNATSGAEGLILASERSDTLDVVLGLRGRHTGSLFIEILDLWIPEYKHVKKIAHKSQIVKQIVQVLKENGVRFLTGSKRSGTGNDALTYTRVEDNDLIEKKIVKYIRYRLNKENERQALLKSVQRKKQTAAVVTPKPNANTTAHGAIAINAPKPSHQHQQQALPGPALLPTFERNHSAFSFANDSTDGIIEAMMTDDLELQVDECCSPAEMVISTLNQHVQKAISEQDQVIQVNDCSLEPRNGDDKGRTSSDQNEVPQQVTVSKSSTTNSNLSASAHAAEVSRAQSLRSHNANINDQRSTSSNNTRSWDEDTVSEMTEGTYENRTRKNYMSKEHTIQENDSSAYSSSDLHLCPTPIYEPWSLEKQLCYEANHEQPTPLNILPKPDATVVARTESTVTVSDGQSSISSSGDDGKSSSKNSNKEEDNNDKKNTNKNNINNNHMNENDRNDAHAMMDTRIFQNVMARMAHLEHAMYKNQSEMGKLRQQVGTLRQQNLYLREQVGVQKQENHHLRERVAVLEHRAAMRHCSDMALLNSGGTDLLSDPTNSANGGGCGSWVEI